MLIRLDVRLVQPIEASKWEVHLESETAFRGAAGGDGRSSWLTPDMRYASAERAVDLLWIVRALSVRWKLVAVLTMVLIAVAASVVSSIVPLYSATAIILIDPGQTEYTDLRSTPGARHDTIWPGDLESYIKVVWSDQLATSVVQSIGPSLFQAHHPTTAEQLLAEVVAGLAPLRNWLADHLGAPLGAPLQRLQLADIDATAADTASVPTEAQRAVEVFGRNLSVVRDSLAAVLQVTYRDADPALAARVANVTAETFPKELVRVQQSTLLATTDYLRERVGALQGDLKATNSQISVLQNKLGGTDGSSIAKVRFGELTRALADAEGEIAGLRLDIVEAGAGDSQPVGDRLASPSVKELRVEELKLARELAQFGSDVGERHPQMVALLATQASIRSSIRAEEARIRSELQRSLRASEATASWLQSELATAEETLARGMDDEVRLRQLQTNTESTRQVYQDILSRYQRASEQQNMVRPPARVINVAQRPDRPDRRRMFLVLAAAAVGSVAAAAALALGLEFRRKGFRISDELAAATGQPIYGSLPLVTTGFGWGSVGAESSTQRQVYAEAVRRLALHVMPPTAQRLGHGRVVLVTSALPAEGKSVASLSLSRQLAETNHRVLLVDTDLHKGTLQRLLDLPEAPTVGLGSLLGSGITYLKDAVVRDTRTDLDILHAGPVVEDPARLLSSGHMAALLANARRHYDVIILDAPPVLSVTDASLIGCLADQLLMVVRWQSTPRQAVWVAIRELRALSERPVGLVLNMIKLASYAGFGGTDQLAYYHAGTGTGYRRVPPLLDGAMIRPHV